MMMMLRCVTLLDRIQKLIRLVRIVLTFVVNFSYIDTYAGMFYYMVGNIDPRLQSSLHTIQLEAVARTQHIDKYGINEILKLLMEEIKKLEEVVVILSFCYFTNIGSNF